MRCPSIVESLCLRADEAGDPISYLAVCPRITKALSWEFGGHEQGAV
jgi:hypothetical protein